MKKAWFLILNFLLLFSLASCAGQQTLKTDITPCDIAAAICKSQSKLPELMQVTSEDTDFNTWMSDYYLLQAEQICGGVICYGDGVEVSEITVLQLTDEKDSKAAVEILNEYIKNRAGVFEGYAPQQAAMIKEGIVVENGSYIALIICPEPQTAKKAFMECFGKDEENSENNTKNNLYDAEAVLQAYRLGDSSSLSESNSSILEAAKDVIESEIGSDMSDYEKELAIHDYITGWSRFDYSVFGRCGSDSFADRSDTPYGVLINKSAMCHGYSSTFQLFMDMLDIECMTVFGIPGSNGVEHSWNMVKLDGEWYHVDCAWDDPIGGSPCHTYFNVTSEYLRKGSIHRWDEAFVPEATGTAYAYGSH